MEAAVVLPVFLVCMLTVMQFLNVYHAAVRLSNAMVQTAEEAAIAACVVDDVVSNDTAQSVLTTAYGSSASRKRAGDLSAIRDLTFAPSVFGGDSQMIRLICTYRPKALTGMVKIPWIIFEQHASVRMWTGRGGSAGTSEAEEGDAEAEGTVYVTEHGTVYHKDRNCSHIRLHIQTVTRQQAAASRNANGARYKPCEHCGSHAGNTVYITTDGTRYHSSLTCGGLKRTVREMKESEASHMRACSRCGGS